MSQGIEVFVGNGARKYSSVVPSVVPTKVIYSETFTISGSWNNSVIYRNIGTPYTNAKYVFITLENPGSVRGAITGNASGRIMHMPHVYAEIVPASSSGNTLAIRMKYFIGSRSDNENGVYTSANSVSVCLWVLGV